MTGTRLDAYRYLEQEGEVRINQNELFGEPLYNIKYKHQGVSFDNPLVRLARGLVINSLLELIETFRWVDEHARIKDSYVTYMYNVIKQKRKEREKKNYG